MGNSKCNNKKRICEIISIIAINILLISGMAIYFPVIEENCERKIIERIEDIGYTTDSISLDEMIMLNEAFDITVEQCVNESRIQRNIYYKSNAYDVETRQYKLVAGSNAQKSIDKLNEVLFGKYEKLEFAGNAMDYGFNKDNPITLEWVLDNPKKLFKIMPFNKVYHTALFYDLYDSIWLNRYEW